MDFILTLSEKKVFGIRFSVNLKNGIIISPGNLRLTGAKLCTWWCINKRIIYVNLTMLCRFIYVLQLERALLNAIVFTGYRKTKVHSFCSQLLFRISKIKSDCFVCIIGTSCCY